jgi:ribosomal protein S18 acetylase RimI-like enzyme
MTAPPAVRLAQACELDIAAAVLADAFTDEAGLNYWLRQGAAKDRARRRFFNAAVRDVVHKERDLWLAEADGAPLGAAIWLGPGKKAYGFSMLQQALITPLLLSIAGVAGAMRGLDLGDRLASHHPSEPHAHLAFLGVAGAAQGRGVGSAILKQTLAPLDKAGLSAFLETTTQRNVALYQRHGFEVTAELVLPGLHCWSMRRDPQR